MQHNTLKLALLTTMILTGAQARAADVPVAPHTELKDCVIQEVLPGKDMTGAYLRLVHKGAPVQLVKAEVPGISRRIELHSMEVKDGVMVMREMTNLQLPEGERVFRKGGDHVMLFDIANKPAIGSRHEITVHFSDNTKASCLAEVKSLQAVMKDFGMKANGHGNTHAPQHRH